MPVYSNVSQFTGKINKMEINMPAEEIKRRMLVWQSSKKTIQSVFPELTEDEREFIMSGTTPQEWDELMQEYDDDYEASDSTARDWLA